MTLTQIIIKSKGLRPPFLIRNFTNNRLTKNSFMDDSIMIKRSSMHKKLTSVLLICLLTTSMTLNAQSIDIQCDYDFYRTNEFKEFVRKEIEKKPVNAEFYKKHEWWEFWRKRIMYFSIDLVTKKVTGGLTGDGLYSPENTSAEIYPDIIMIKQQVEYNEYPNQKHLVHDFYINRLDGSLFASEYNVDSKTNKDVKTYSIHGTCKRIDRLF